MRRSRRFRRSLVAERALRRAGCGQRPAGARLAGCRGVRVVGCGAGEAPRHHTGPAEVPGPRPWALRPPPDPGEPERCPPPRPPPPRKPGETPPAPPPPPPRRPADHEPPCSLSPFSLTVLTRSTI